MGFAAGIENTEVGGNGFNLTRTSPHARLSVTSDSIRHSIV